MRVRGGFVRYNQKKRCSHIVNYWTTEKQYQPKNIEFLFVEFSAIDFLLKILDTLASLVDHPRFGWSATR